VESCLFSVTTERLPKLSDRNEPPDLVLHEGRDYTTHDIPVKVINARARSNAVNWGFGALISTVLIGIIAFVILDIAKLETLTLREWLQTTIAGELGLLAGMLGTSERS
jgi:hypothetical protein